jgi:hypothetical protein
MAKRSPVKRASGGSGWRTPLGIIATFLALTETVLGISLTRVSGYVQGALTGFVIVFPIMVAIGFFAILWNRAHVFYSPAEFGDTDPAEYASAMRTGLPSEFVKQIESIKEDPFDKDKQFALIDGLIEDIKRQMIILMTEKNVGIPLMIPLTVYTGSDRAWSSGLLSGYDMVQRLKGTGLVTGSVESNTTSLTEYGQEFGTWLMKTGRRAKFLKSPLGEWGEPFVPPGGPGQVGFPGPVAPFKVQAATTPGEADPSVRVALPSNKVIDNEAPPS